MDRTNDYIRICHLFDNTGKMNLSTIHLPLSIFTRSAQKISDHIIENDKLLIQLNQLVNIKSILLIKDPTENINKIINILKNNLEIIFKDIDTFDQSIRTANKHQRNHFAVIVASLRSRTSKNAKDLQECLAIRTNILKEQSFRRSKFSHTGRSPIIQLNQPIYNNINANDQKENINIITNNNISNNINTNITNINHNHNINNNSINNINNQPMPPSYSNSVYTKDNLNSMNDGIRRRPPIAGNFFSYQQPTRDLKDNFYNNNNSRYMQQQIYNNNDHTNIAKNRLENATQVESTIVELSGMFSRMAAMVAEQGEIVTRIDDNMDITLLNVEAGQNELLKYFKTVSGNRGLVIKIFLVLILFIFLFVVVF